MSSLPILRPSPRPLPPPSPLPSSFQRSKKKKPRSVNGNNNWGDRDATSSSSSSATTRAVLFVVKVTFVFLLCGSSYLAGSLCGRWPPEFDHRAHNGIHAPPVASVGRLVHGHGPGTGEGGSGCGEGAKEAAEKELIESTVKKELEQRRRELGKGAGSSQGSASKAETRRFPKTTEKFINGMARTRKDDLAELFDFGNPMDRAEGTGQEDALVIYHSKSAIPDTDPALTRSAEYDDGNGIPLADPKTVTENCDAMNVIFTENPGNTRQCTAIVGNYESYHVQRWMKVDTVKSTKVDPALPLVPVSRGYASRGKANFYAPPFDGKFSPVHRHWKMMTTFLQNADSVLADLSPILQRVARDNAVVVLTCNMGQSQLLMNFACSARRRGFDLGNVLVFPTDEETRDLAEGLGLATYYDEKNMGPLPSGEAKRYGDRNFKAMMYAKVLCVLYPLLLNYDVLFQDVDLVWLDPKRDPMKFFHDESSKISDFDVIFQHDGSNSVRYAPYSANSGFYYVRANKRSQYLFTSLLYHSDLIINWDSHQQVLVQLLSEHSSLFGLNVKVLGRDTDMFPGGYHYHRNRVFMKKFIKRETDSYIFHMSWTENKDNKLLFLRQLGEWYVKDTCVGKTATAILLGGGISSGDAALVEPCCAVEPILSCHYRDKPSKLPCKSSDPIDKNGKSFW